MERSWGRLEWGVYDRKTRALPHSHDCTWIAADEVRGTCEGAPKEGFVDVGYLKLLKMECGRKHAGSSKCEEKYTGGETPALAFPARTKPWRGTNRFSSSHTIITRYGKSTAIAQSP
jgi:hypothetical protein